MTSQDETTLQLSPEQAKTAIEAILFAAGYPVETEKLAMVLQMNKKEVRALIDEMIPTYIGRGIQLIWVGSCAQLCTKEAYEDLIRSALGIRGGGSLSPSMTEVLAIIAYHQPVTRAFIEQVRGVDCSYAINMLGEKHLIECVGRLEVPGRPMLYATTDDFLRSFGLEGLEQLPQTELPEPLAETEPSAPAKENEAAVQADLPLPEKEALTESASPSAE